jgi:cytochrome c
LARQLAGTTGLPLHVVDKLQFKNGGAAVPLQEYLKLHSDLLTRETWIIDGYGDTVKASPQGSLGMSKLVIAIVVAIGPVTSALAASGDIARGQRDFRACAPCHSLESNRNMTGPSLAGLWDRKAGSLTGFERYSDALKASGIIWNDRSLDGWLTDPQKMVPDNDMPFEGIKDASAREDLLAFLKQATKPGAQQRMAQQGGMKGMGGMGGGMMSGGHDPNLKSLEPGKQVKTITYCHDSYRVTTADGKTRPFWERNLRFMTDSSQDGPANGAPAIMPAGMMGDRASVIFAAPEEINKTIEAKC